MPTDTSPTTLLPRSALASLATAHREDFDAKAAEADRQQRQTERVLAAADAHDHITQLFPETLARVLPPEAWAGYWEDEKSDADYAASAVAHLDDGMFVRHVHRQSDDGSHHEVTLIRPCSCGGYREARIHHDYTLAQELERAQSHRDNDFCPDS